MRSEFEETTGASGVKLRISKQTSCKAGLFGHAAVMLTITTPWLPITSLCVRSPLTVLTCGMERGAGQYQRTKRNVGRLINDNSMGTGLIYIYMDLPAVAFW